MRCERGSVVAVLPASSHVNRERRGGKPMRVVGLDIHRVFAEAVMLDDGRVIRLGRIGMTRDHLEAFARKLDARRPCRDRSDRQCHGGRRGDLPPHVGRVVIANPRRCG